MSKVSLPNQSAFQTNFSEAECLLWTMPTLSKRIGLSRSNIYQKIQEGSFPPPLKLGRSVRWLPADIHEWVNTQASARSLKTEG